MSKNESNDRLEGREKVIIFTDGSCKPNPGLGGWGALIKLPIIGEVEICGSEEGTTNNRMEMMGAIKALESLPGIHPVVLNTDSKYLKDGITQWIKKWKSKGWVTKGKGEVKNKDLWLRLDALCEKHVVEWRWVKGHANVRGNEVADQLAALARLSASDEYKTQEKRKEKTKEKANVSNVYYLPLARG